MLEEHSGISVGEMEVDGQQGPAVFLHMFMRI